LASNPFPLKFTRDVGGADAGLRKIDPRGVGTGVGVLMGAEMVSETVWWPSDASSVNVRLPVLGPGLAALMAT
jgi:hypothetical protein